jgi:hypothetical protein
LGFLQTHLVSDKDLHPKRTITILHRDIWSKRPAVHLESAIPDGNHAARPKDVHSPVSLAVVVLDLRGIRHAVSARPGRKL